MVAHEEEAHREAVTGGVPSRALVPHLTVVDGVDMEAEAERH